MVGTGKGAELGILIRGGEAWRPRTSSTRSCWTRPARSPPASPRSPTSLRAGGFDEDELLRLAAAAGAGSEHPLAAAIVAAPRERGLDAAAAEDFASITGHGVDGHGRRARASLVGNAALLASAASTPPNSQLTRPRLAAEGKTPMLVAVDGQPGRPARRGRHRQGRLGRGGRRAARRWACRS